MRASRRVLTLFLVAVLIATFAPFPTLAEGSASGLPKAGQTVCLAPGLKIKWTGNAQAWESYEVIPLTPALPLLIATFCPPVGTIALVVAGGVVIAYVVVKLGPQFIQTISGLYNQLRLRWCTSLDWWTNNQVYSTKAYPELPQAIPGIPIPEHVANESDPRHPERWMSFWTTIAACLAGKPPSFCGWRDNGDGTKTFLILYESSSWVVKLLTGGIWCKGGYGALIGQGETPNGGNLYERSTGITGGEQGNQLEKVKSQFTPFPPDDCPSIKDLLPSTA